MKSEVRMVAKRGPARSIVFRNLADVIGPIGLGGAIGSVWLMPLGGSWQFLMAASALAAASQLLFFVNFSEPTVAKRTALAYRMVAS
jgi:glucose dehydrogenase